jgi:hypothetical protein
VTAPDNYNLVHEGKISVMPEAMFDYGYAHMETVLRNIVGSWNKIVAVWNDLDLGWSGDTADEAKAFQQRLDHVQTQLFGKAAAGGAEAQPGVLDNVRMLVAKAAGNYDRSESVVASVFNSLAQSILYGPTPPKGQDPPAVNHTDPPITEIF